MSTEVSFTATKKARPSMMNQVVLTKTPARSSILRSSMGPGGMTMTSRTNVVSRGAAPAPGELAQIGRTSVQSVKDTRSNEKKDLNNLNSKLAEHLEKTKFMEGMNKQLKMQLDKLKALKMFDDTKIKELCSDELDEMRGTIKELNERCAALQAENLKLKDKVDTTREDILILRGQRDNLVEDKEKLCRINADLEGDINKLRKEIEFADQKRRMAIEELNGCRDDVERLQNDLQCAQEEQMNLADKLNALQEEYEFQLDCKEAECEELKKLIRQLQTSEPDYSKMWEGQFKESLMKLQQENDDRINKHIADVQRQYELKIQRMQTQVKRDEPDGITKAQTKTLKSEVGNLNTRLSGLDHENQMLRDQLAKLQEDYRKQCEECEQEKDELKRKLDEEREDRAEIQELLEKLMLDKGNLDAELNTYRCLLNEGLAPSLAAEGSFQSQGGAMISEAMMGGGMSGMSMSGGRGGSSSQSSTMSESKGTLKVTRQSSCPMSIVQISQDGKFVCLSNGSTSRDFNMSEWTLERNHPRGTSKFVFPKDFSVKAKSQVQIWAKQCEKEAQIGDQVASCNTWGTGDGELILRNEKGEKKASSSMAYQLK